ncbi:MAG: hypothetical protein O3A66_00815, partial [Proteobacteria bacterium]|nr:hypothetical protein [Pseudomonadota bacterium]
GSQIQQIQQYNNLALQQGIIDFANANNSANESHLQLNASHYSGMSNLLNLKLDNQSGRNSQSRQKNDIIQESTRRGGFSLWCC